jgi:hypothetical protein
MISMLSSMLFSAIAITCIAFIIGRWVCSAISVISIIPDEHIKFDFYSKSATTSSCAPPFAHALASASATPTSPPTKVVPPFFMRKKRSTDPKVLAALRLERLKLANKILDNKARHSEMRQLVSDYNEHARNFCDSLEPHKKHADDFNERVKQFSANNARVSQQHDIFAGEKTQDFTELTALSSVEMEQLKQSDDDCKKSRGTMLEGRRTLAAESIFFQRQLRDSDNVIRNVKVSLSHILWRAIAHYSPRFSIVSHMTTTIRLLLHHSRPNGPATMQTLAPPLLRAHPAHRVAVVAGLHRPTHTQPRAIATMATSLSLATQAIATSLSLATQAIAAMATSLSLTTQEIATMATSLSLTTQTRNKCQRKLTARRTDTNFRHGPRLPISAFPCALRTTNFHFERSHTPLPNTTTHQRALTTGIGRMNDAAWGPMCTTTCSERFSEP